MLRIFLKIFLGLFCFLTCPSHLPFHLASRCPPFPFPKKRSLCFDPRFKLSNVSWFFCLACLVSVYWQVFTCYILFVKKQHNTSLNCCVLQTKPLLRLVFIQKIPIFWLHFVLWLFLTLISIAPLCSVTKDPLMSSKIFVSKLMWIFRAVARLMIA